MKLLIPLVLEPVTQQWGTITIRARYQLKSGAMKREGAGGAREGGTTEGG